MADKLQDCIFPSPMIVATDTLALPRLFVNVGTYAYPLDLLRGRLRIAEALAPHVEFHPFVGTAGLRPGPSLSW